MAHDVLENEALNTLQRKSFLECEGNIAQRVRQCGATETRPSGLTVEGKITEVTLNSSTWVALPLTALTDRNTVGVQNTTGIEIKLNYDNTVSTYTGVIVGSGSERYYGITDDIIVYAKAQSGNPVVIVEELA